MVIFLLRHADREPDVDDLSKKGVARAKLLARMLGETGIRTGYCSDARRTRRTLEPLEAKIGAAFKLVEVPTEDPGGIERHIETVVTAIRALPADAFAAVVGHTNTIPQIIEGLGGGLDGTAIGETEFDRLFALSRAPGGFVALVKLRYGAPT